MASVVPNNEETQFKTGAEQVEIARQGGIASGKAKKQKKLIKDNIELLLGLPIKNNKTKEQLKALGIDDTEMNNQMAMVIAMYQKALKGDVQAFNTLRDTLGQGITNKVAIEQVPQIIDDIK